MMQITYFITKTLVFFLIQIFNKNYILLLVFHNPYTIHKFFLLTAFLIFLLPLILCSLYISLLLAINSYIILIYINSQSILQMRYLQNYNQANYLIRHFFRLHSLQLILYQTIIHITYLNF